MIQTPILILQIPNEKEYKSQLIINLKFIFDLYNIR